MKKAIFWIILLILFLLIPLFFSIWFNGGGIEGDKWEPVYKDSGDGNKIEFNP